MNEFQRDRQTIAGRTPNLRFAATTESRSEREGPNPFTRFQAQADTHGRSFPQRRAQATVQTASATSKALERHRGYGHIIWAHAPERLDIEEANIFGIVLNPLATAFYVVTHQDTEDFIDVTAKRE